MCSHYLQVFGMMLIFLGVGVNVVDASPNQPDNRSVGWIIDTVDGAKHFHFWNEIDDYYINITNNTYVALTNHPNEYWSNNVLCLGYKNPNWNYKCFDEFNNINTFKTYVENESIEMTGWKDVTVLGRTVRLALRYYLGSEYDRLNITIYMENVRALLVNFEIGFVWRINNIVINTTEEWDVMQYNILNHTKWNDTINNVTYEFESNESLVRMSLNETYNKVTPFSALSRGEFMIYDREPGHPDTDQMIKMWFDKGLNGWLFTDSENNTENESVNILINAGTLAVGQNKSTVFHWIDIDPFASCLGGYFALGATLIFTNTSIETETPQEMACGYSAIAFGDPQCPVYWVSASTPPTNPRKNWIETDYPGVSNSQPQARKSPHDNNWSNPATGSNSGKLMYRNTTWGLRAGTPARPWCVVGAEEAQAEMNITSYDNTPPIGHLVYPSPNNTQINTTTNDTEINITFTCTDDTNVVGMIIWDNGTLVVFKPYSRTSAHYNVTEVFTSTKDVGHYRYNGFCSDANQSANTVTTRQQFYIIVNVPILDEFGYEFAIIGGLSLSGLVLMYLGIMFEKKHYPLKILLITGGLFIFSAVFQTGSIVTTGENADAVVLMDALSGAWIWIVVGTIAFFLIAVFVVWDSIVGDRFGKK